MGFIRNILFLFFLSAGSLFAQEDAILWRAENALQWGDFRAAPPAGKKVAATTASGLSYNYSAKGVGGKYKLDFQVDAFFYPDKSWYHPDLVDSVILSHEQLHFDISELYARKFRKILSQRVFSENVREEVKELFAEINRELSLFQDRYDLETDFSRNRGAQLEWNARISRELGKDL